jgi:tetratricopeptide (TPR) repeat protein
MKALLLARGHALYSEVWNDQPPFFTWLLRAWFGLWGWDVTAGRLLVLLFAAAAVFALYDILRPPWGHGAALAAVALLCASSYFLQLSVSIMVGLPALSVALLGVWALFQWHRRRSVKWLVLGGTLFGLSLTIKLFTALMAPWLALWLVVEGWHRKDAGVGGRLKPVGVFLATAALVSGSILLAGVGPQHVTQLFAVHLLGRRNDLASASADAAMLWANLGRDREVLALAAVGVGWILARRRFELLVFPAWAVAAAYVLASHSPLWYHHHLLLGLPAAACAGVAAGELFARRTWRGLSPRDLVPAVARLTAAVLLTVLAVALLQGRKREDTKLLASSDRDRFAAEVMREYAAETHWVLADRPMLPFRAGLATPPDVAVFTHKRIVTGALTLKDLLAVMERLQPEQVVLTWKTPPALARELARAVEGRYQMVVGDSGPFPLRLYVRREVLSDPLPRVQRAVARMPWVAQGHNALGLLWGARGETEQAIAALKRALDLDPRSLPQRARLGDAMLAMGRLEEGFAVLRAGLDSADTGQKARAAALYGWRLATVPDGSLRGTAAGQSELRRAEQTVAASPRPDPVALAAILAAQGRFVAAEDIIQKAVAEALGANESLRAARLSELRDAFRAGRPWMAPVRAPWQ